MFRALAQPLKDLGANDVTRATGGTDHISFDAIGLPGFQFIQDPIEYELARTTRTSTRSTASRPTT